MEPDHRPDFASNWPEIWTEWDRWLANHGDDAVRACLSFVLTEPQIDRCVVGAETLGQLRELTRIADAPRMPGSPPDWTIAPPRELAKPSLWPRP